MELLSEKPPVLKVIFPCKAIEAVVVALRENPDSIFLLPSATLLLGLGVCGQSAPKVCAPKLNIHDAVMSGNSFGGSIVIK
jgi:hypothetical protein